MIYTNAETLITSFRKLADETRIMLFYRYFSLSITSFFFLASDLNYPLHKKIFIIICLVIASLLLGFLYTIHQKSEVRITILVLMETIGVTVLLIPSGGLESPFVWYSLNTILAASILLNKHYCWQNLAFYLTAATLLTYRIFNYEDMALLTYIMSKRNLVLCFLLVTAVVQLLARYGKRIQHHRQALSETVQKLAEANLQTRQTMHSLVELYQAVHLLTSQKDERSVIFLIIQCAKEMAKTGHICYYPLSADFQGMMTEKGDFPPFLVKSLENSLLQYLSSLKTSEEPVEVDCCESIYLLVPVRSVHKLFGVLCIEKSGSQYLKNVNYMEHMRVFTKLCASVLEKSELEAVKNRFLISEEQNRIANEIHDGVLQRLFSISCGMYSLSKRFPKMDFTQVSEELYIIRNAVDSAMRELREKIYGMSWKKNGQNAFEEDIQNYLAEVRNLHRVEIISDISGNQELLTVSQKKAFYRIIREGMGNALRHGNAKKINIVLKIRHRDCQLSIRDDGMGFHINRENNNNKGLGLDNIQFLVHSMEGTAKFNSEIGSGTNIEVTVPLRTEDISKEEII